jgi:hypothetical protein
MTKVDWLAAVTLLITLHYKEFIAENHHHYTVPMTDIHFLYF